MQKTDDKYVPGICNIGKEESLKRLKTGIFGLILTCTLSFLFFVFNFGKFITFIFLFISSLISAIGLLQYKHKFCVYYAFREVFNFKTIANVTHISKAEDSEKDKQRALEIFIYAFLIAFAYALLYTLLA